MDERGIDVISSRRRDRVFEDNERNYKRMREESLSGESVRRVRRKKKVSSKSFSKRMKKYFGAAVFGAVVAVGGLNVTSNLMDNATVNGMTSEFYESIVSPSTHRTDDKKNYYYDYQDIASKMQEMYNFDEGVYYLVQSMGEEQTDLVLAHTEYENLDNYIEEKGFKDSEEFKEKLMDVIILGDEVENKTKELDKMLEDNNMKTPKTSSEFESIGGK